MPWVGLKKIAFIPLYRTNAAPPDQIPANWTADILRRINNDPDASGADRSLKAYIRAASSGIADFDGTVFPMETVTGQDIPPTALEAQMGARLRNEGYDAAAIVMLGGPGAGTNNGFWSRFVMREGVGVWAMELMHSLTGFWDLYPFNGNMGSFDQMACSCATYPSAYTKAAIQWLDPSSIVKHNGLAGVYPLHSISLGSPPAGQISAVRIGDKVPYIMVEERKRTDQFEKNIPSEGVIVYKVQTNNPLGFPEHEMMPVNLLTPTALKPGEKIITDTGVYVEVLNHAANGQKSVKIYDYSKHVYDRTAEFGIPNAKGSQTACVVLNHGGIDIHNIIYRDGDNHLHELWRNSHGHTATADLTKNANAKSSEGNPFIYVDTLRQTQILLFRSNDRIVRSLYWKPRQFSTSPWADGIVGTDNLGGTANSPAAEGDPVGYYDALTDYHHMVYRGTDDHLHELNCHGVEPIVYGGNLSGTISAPEAVGNPSGCVNGDGTNIVVYRSKDKRILSIYWKDGPSGLDDLSGVAGTPRPLSDPIAFYTPHDDVIQIVYVGEDKHIWELYSKGNAPIVGWDLSAQSGAPAPELEMPAAYYSPGTNTKHVIYRSPDGKLHEIWWVPGGGLPAHVSITDAYHNPLAKDRPIAFSVDGNDGPVTQHVVYRGPNNHVYEIVW